MSHQLVSGRLTADAAARCSAGDDWLMVVEFTPPPVTGSKPMKVRAVTRYGSGAAAALACKGRAGLLRRGVLVEVEAASLSWRRGRLELGDVNHRQLRAPDIDAAIIELQRRRYGE